ncbi:MAG: quinone-dependent dihydroorotate dehydrogenase [Pseudomonadota bacterium]
MDLLYSLARPALFSLEPETAHRLSIVAIKSGALPRFSAALDSRLSVGVAGLSFPNPVGLAAGFDKNGEVPVELLRLGFGFAEIGSVTPKPQVGGDKPRVFRLPSDRGMINRLGFNNEGHERVLKRLEALGSGRPGPLGVNVGANKDSNDRIADYALGIEKFYDVADYFAVNVSSPNTPGLRDLQAKDSLASLLTAVLAARQARCDGGKVHKPIFLKVAPDLEENDLADIGELVAAQALDGLIVSNTTISRSGLAPGRNTKEAGGLSGKPLFERSTIVLAKLRQMVGPDKTIIGVGGIDSAQTAEEKIRAGADLVQLYTGFVYEGPGLIGSMLTGLLQAIEQDNAATIRDLRDTKLDDWATKTLPR